jgi:FkbM family methyltransferase
VYSFGRGFDIGPNDVVVDLGCNVGVFTVLAACAGRSVLAVEAQAGLVGEAESTLQMNGCADRARIVHALVGADSGFFHADPRLVDDPWIGDPPRITMSDLLVNLPVVDLLKVDIEGSEFALFSEEPNLSWLTGVRRITMEVHPEFGCASSLSSTLAARGFRFQFVTNHGASTENLDEIGYLFAWR